MRYMGMKLMILYKAERNNDEIDLEDMGGRERGYK